VPAPSHRGPVRGVLEHADDLYGLVCLPASLDRRWRSVSFRSVPASCRQVEGSLVVLVSVEYTEYGGAAEMAVKIPSCVQGRAVEHAVSGFLRFGGRKPEVPHQIRAVEPGEPDG